MIAIQAFCLRNIAEKGKIYHSNKIVNLPLIDTEKGVNSAGTFHLICNTCDNTCFSGL